MPDIEKLQKKIEKTDQELSKLKCKHKKLTSRAQAVVMYHELDCYDNDMMLAIKDLRQILDKE